MRLVDEIPEKLFYHSYGDDQDLICILGATGTYGITFDRFPDEHCHFGSVNVRPK